MAKDILSVAQESVINLKEFFIDLPSHRADEPFLMLLLAAFLFLSSCLLLIREGRKEKDSEQEAVCKTKLVTEKATNKTTVKKATAEKIIAKDAEAEKDLTTQEIKAAGNQATVSDGLSKSRNHLFSGITNLFKGKSAIDDSVLSSLEELLITSDLGVKTTDKLLSKVKEQMQLGCTFEDVISCLRTSILEILSKDAKGEIVPTSTSGPFVILVVGVNGVGKTTTIGKLSSRLKNSGSRVLLAACDTFRAAAVEQLEAWASRNEIDIVSKKGENVKPSTVAYDAIAKAKADSYDVLIIDTAGRLHTRVNLMNELEKIHGLLSKGIEDAPHETILVLDACTGQNALQQAREFNKRASLTGLVVTKLDGTPKGGIVVAIKDELGIPIRYIGIGEGVDDLKTFNAEEFTDALLDAETKQSQASINYRDEQKPASPTKRVAKRTRRIS